MTNESPDTRGIIDYTHTTTSANETNSETPSIEAMCKLVRELKARFPSVSTVVKVEMPRSVLNELHRQVAIVHRAAASPLQIEGIPIEINEAIPANCYTMEYADGHVDCVTPFGKFQIKEPR